MSQEESSMTNGGNLREWAEHTQGTINFILQQQAQFTADMQQLREAQARSEERWERVERMWVRTEESVRTLVTIAERHDDEINTLRESQAQTDRQMRETDGRLRETDERINALVNAVEALISGRRNGGERREGS